MKLKRCDKCYVYILRCANGNYYTGSTKNLKNRLKLHNSGRGAKYLRGKLPVKLAYVKKLRCYKSALSAERNIKKLTHNQKEKLINIYRRKSKIRSLRGL